MAEGLARKILREKGATDGIKVISAGTAALPGAPATPEAVEVMKAKGVDLTNHRARELTQEMVREADLVLTMTQAQKNFVMKLLPSSCNRVYTLKDYILEKREGLGDLQKVAELMKKLEEKQQKFYMQYGAEIERLKEEHSILEGRLREIEEKLTRIEMEFAAQTEEERQELVRLEESTRALDIVDPFGKGIEVYRRCADELEESVDKALGRFVNELD